MLISNLSRLLITLVCITGLLACSGGGGGSNTDNNTGGGTTPPPAVESFTVSLSQESIDIEPNVAHEINYTINREGSNQFDVEVSVATQPSVGTVSLNSDNSTVTFTSDTEGNGSFSLLFKSATLQINKQVVFKVENTSTTTPDPDPGPDPVTPPLTNDQEYIIYLPSEYITIYEGETVVVDLKRNYEINEQVIEEFYFKTDNIQGSVSDDKKQMTLIAIDSEEDTYGEITAVTNVNGVLHESKMYIIYYNKNRDLTTPEPPVVALLEHEIKVAPYASTVKSFDIYDPDSDRISYRVLSSPTWTKTHMAKVPNGYELTVHTVGAIDPNDNDVVVEVSDAHKKDIHTFNLVEDTSVTNKENKPPVLSIEENVTVSLIKQFTGSEKGQIAELAFVHSDPDGDEITLSATASVDGKYSFNIQPPYLYVSAENISDLQYDQITLIASDGKFNTKLTFHFYVKDNFLTFRGGNPNTAPTTNLPTELRLLEGKRVEIPFNSSDHEKHPFDVGIEKDSAFVQMLLTDSQLVLTPTKPEVTTQSSVSIWLEDVFESRREHTIALTIFKNTAPTVELDFESTEEKDEPPFAIKEVEQTPVKVKVKVTDPNEPELQPTFVFNSTFLTVDYKDGVATINSRDLKADYKGQVIVRATDEFDAVGEQVIDVDYQFKDPNNQFPVITIAKEEFEVLPGGKASTTVTIVDPENDSLVIDSKKDSEAITYTYNIATGLLEFEVDKSAKFQQQFIITITASDGFGLSQKNVVIKVPKSPEAPTLTIDFYEQEVPEETPFTITFSATDGNNEDIEVSTIIPNETGLTVKIVESQKAPGLFRGYLDIKPIDNVLSDKTYTFTLAARDSSGEVDSKTITVTVKPVNDPPELEFVVLDGLKPGESGEIVLANKEFVTLSYGIKDPDTTGQEVRTIYAVKSGIYEFDSDTNREYGYFIDSFVTTSSNQIRINGNSKKDVFGYLSAKKGSLAVNGDTLKDTLKVQVQEEISAGSNSSHGDEKDVDITLKFVNNKPVVASFDLIQLLENQTQTINLSITDGDIPNRAQIAEGGEELCITIHNASAFIDLYDVRPTTPTLLNLGQKYCDTDTEGPLLQLRINTKAVTSDESEFFTLNVNDGYENSSQIINVKIINN